MLSLSDNATVKTIPDMCIQVACSCTLDVTSLPLAAIDENFTSGLGSMRI